jgi:hypothetical protein
MQSFLFFLSGIQETPKSHLTLSRYDPQDFWIIIFKQNKLRGLSSRPNYTDRATTACRQS